MKNTINFASSTSFSCGSKRLAIHKASLFCFRAKGVFLPISGGLPLPNAKKRTARASGLVDGGIRQAAFLSAYVNKSTHAHRNSHTDRPPRKGGGTAKAGSRTKNAKKAFKTAGKTPEKRGVRLAGNCGFLAILASLSNHFTRTQFSY